MSSEDSSQFREGDSNEQLVTELPKNQLDSPDYEFEQQAAKRTPGNEPEEDESETIAPETSTANDDPTEEDTSYQSAKESVEPKVSEADPKAVNHLYDENLLKNPAVVQLLKSLQKKGGD